MTDRESAIRLGRYIIALRQQILEYEAVFMEYRISDEYGRRREIPFREDARRIGEEEALKRIAVELQNELLQGIGQQSEPSALIRELCRQFLEGM